MKTELQYFKEQFEDLAEQVIEERKSELFYVMDEILYLSKSASSDELWAFNKIEDMVMARVTELNKIKEQL